MKMAIFINTNDPEYYLDGTSLWWSVWHMISDDLRPSEYMMFEDDKAIIEWELTGRCREIFEDGQRLSWDEVEVAISWTRSIGIWPFVTRKSVEVMVWLPETWLLREPQIVYKVKDTCDFFKDE